MAVIERNEIAPDELGDLAALGPVEVSTGLRKNSLPYIETLAQSIANIAPTATPATNLQLAFASAGSGTWLTYLLSTIGLVLIGICINQFAKHTATPGSLYSYVTKGLGSAAGFITGWALILAYLATGMAEVAGASNYATATLAKVHIATNPYLAYFVLSALVWYVAFRDVRFSAKLMLFLEFGSVSLITLLGFMMLRKTGIHVDMDQLSLKGMHLADLRSGMVLAIFSFVGFESATALGGESQNPLKSIPKAVIQSTVIAGLFFVIMSFIMVSGFKHYSVSLDKVPAALDAMAIIAQTPVLGIFVTVAATVSLFACSLACVTAVSRILMSMARDGFLPAAIGKAHEKNATPAVAATVCAIFLFIVPALMTFKGFAELDVYNMTGTIATYGFLLAYILVAIGAVVFVARQKALTIGLTLAAIGGIGFMGMAVYGSIAPWPAAPCNTLPAIFGAYLVIGLIWHIVTKLGKQAAPTAELS